MNPCRPITLAVGLTVVLVGCGSDSRAPIEEFLDASQDELTVAQYWTGSVRLRLRGVEEYEYVDSIHANQVKTQVLQQEIELQQEAVTILEEELREATGSGLRGAGMERAQGLERAIEELRGAIERNKDLRIDLLGQADRGNMIHRYDVTHRGPDGVSIQTRFSFEVVRAEERWLISDAFGPEDPFRRLPSAERIARESLRGVQRN